MRGKVASPSKRAVIVLLKEPNDSICARTVKLAFSGISLVLFFSFFDPRISAVLLLCLNVSAHLAYSDSLSFSPILFFSARVTNYLSLRVNGEVSA